MTTFILLIVFVFQLDFPVFFAHSTTSYEIKSMRKCHSVKIIKMIRMIFVPCADCEDKVTFGFFSTISDGNKM